MKHSIHNGVVHRREYLNVWPDLTSLNVDAQMQNVMDLAQATTALQNVAYINTLVNPTMSVTRQLTVAVQEVFASYSTTLITALGVLVSL